MSMDIKERIDTLFTELANDVNPVMFTLSKRAVEIYNEIDELRDECEHEFVDGECIYCYFQEEDEGNETDE